MQVAREAGDDRELIPLDAGEDGDPCARGRLVYGGQHGRAVSLARGSDENRDHRGISPAERGRRRPDQVGWLVAQDVVDGEGLEPRTLSNVQFDRDRSFELALAPKKPVFGGPLPRAGDASAPDAQ